MRRASKVDSNHVAVVKALRKNGCVVISLAALGKGIPDLLAYRRAAGLLRLIEVKTPGREQKLTTAQAKAFPRLPVWVVSSPEAALAAMEIGLDQSTSRKIAS